MKPYLFAFCNFFIALLLVSCGPGSFEAAEYNDKVVDQQLIVVGKYDAFIDAINDTSVTADVYKQKLQDLSAQLQASTNVLKSMEKFDDKTEFADSCLKLLSVFNDVVKNEFTQVVAIYDQQVYTEEDAKKVDNIFTLSNMKVKVGLEAFTAAQKVFAAKYHFKVKDESPLPLKK